MPKENLKEFIGIRMSTTDRQFVDAAADAEGLSLSGFIREAAIDCALAALQAHERARPKAVTE